MTNNKNILIIGIGNTLRSDDGIGAHICNLLEAKKLNGVETMIVQQLDITMAETIATFNKVIFVDAAVNEATVSFQPVLLNEPLSSSFTHHVNAAMLAGLAAKLYPGNTGYYLCTVGGNDFEMGTALSTTAQTTAKQAIDILTEWIALNS